MENTVTDMGTVVNSITTALSSENLWSVVGSIVPFLAISVLFGLRILFNKTYNQQNKESKRWNVIFNGVRFFLSPVFFKEVLLCLI